MQTLGLTNQSNSFQLNSSALASTGFWRRQFQMQSTKTQRGFDWTFGVIMPVICFVFDPIVFKGGFDGGPILEKYRAFAYLLSFASVMSMAAWLIWGEKLKGLNAFLAGLFLTSGLVSLIVGVFLFPFSVLGLFLIIGILGFTPLFSATVFLRNARRVYQTAKPSLEIKVFAGLFALGTVFSAAIPWAINSEINRMIDEMLDGDAQTVRTVGQKLKIVSPLADFTRIKNRAYNKFQDEEKKRALNEVYQELAGEQTEDGWIKTFARMSD